MLLAALALFAGPSVSAQPPASAQTALPAELLAPSEEARAAFEALASHPLTDEFMERRVHAQPAGYMRPVDDVIDRTLAGGPAVADWQDLGLDDRAVVAAHDGGLAANMIEGVNQFGPTFGYYVDRQIERLIPPEWVLIGRRGALVSGENIEIGVTRLSPKVILVERVAFARRGHAYCRGQAESRLYADPAVPASQLDMVAAAFTMRFLATIERRHLCDVVEDAGQGQYRDRFFDSEGHPLAGLDSGSPRFRIVPLRPVPATAPR